ncbi:glucokinase [Desulfobacterota bacterium M19]
MTEKLFLAGDIGGTKTNLAIFSSVQGIRAPLTAVSYKSSDFDDFSLMLREFIAGSGLKVKAAAFGVAGPVTGGRAVITKLPWTIDAARLRDEFHIDKVVVVNDLLATARGISSLTAAELITLNSGREQAGAPRVVIAPGTGLGESFMIWENGAYRPCASEGGHSLFAPATALEDELLCYLRRRYTVITNDMLCSGRGIPLLYKFLQQRQPWPTAKESPAILRAADPAPLIAEAALAEPFSELCLAVMELFVSLLAAEAANLALKVLAAGGVFVGGGIPPRIMPLLSRCFMPAFTGGGVLRDFLADIPVRVIKNQQTALLGAASLLSGECAEKVSVS